MARIFIAWEMGDSIGHLAHFPSIVHELVARGHELFFALADPTYLELFDFKNDVTVLPAPSAKGQWSQEVEIICNSSILLQRGYGDVNQLTTLTRCWHGLYRLVNPDMYLFDYAPTAMLAAWGAQKPKVLVGSGFGSLVPGQANIDLAPWHKNSRTLLKQHEEMVVKTINEVCGYFQYDPVNYLSDIYQCDLSLMSGIPELDEYQRDPDTTIYYNLLYGAANLPKPQWSENGGTKIFAYLRAHISQCRMVLDVLADGNFDVICYCAGLDASSADMYRSRGINLYQELVSLADMLPEAQIVVCHAGNGLVSLSLRSGVPLLQVPGHLEQYHTAGTVEQLGAGLRVPRQAEKEGIESRLEELELDPVYRQSAGLLAHRNPLQNNEMELTIISDRLQRLLDR